MPIGPWRCLPMMTSARPCSASIRLCHFIMRLDVVVARLLALLVVLLAEDEHHHVGVLLDRARLAQVGELRALVLAALDLPRELAERHDRDVELLGDRLQPLGDLRDLLHPVLRAVDARRARAAGSRRTARRARAGASAAGRARRWSRSAAPGCRRCRAGSSPDRFAASMKRRISLLGHVAVADLVARAPAPPPTRMRAASCSADISSEKKPTTPPSTAPSLPSGRVPWR